MTFDEILEQVLDILRRRGRVRRSLATRISTPHPPPAPR